MEPLQSPQDAIVINSAAEFQSRALEASAAKPVVVDFHAEWCAPCKQLAPILAAEVGKTRGAVLLVTVDVDKNRQIAGSLRVNSLPTVMALWQGRPAGGFTGVQPPKKVAAFVAKLRALAGGEEKQAEGKVLAEAFSALDRRDAALAIQMFSEVLERRTDNAAAMAGMALCYLQNGDTERAEALLAAIPEAGKNDKHLKRAEVFLRLLKREDESPHLRLFKRGEYTQAVEQLLAAIAADRGDKQLRELLLEIFTSLGGDNPTTAKGRRRLSAILFS